MAANNETESKETGEPERQQVSFYVEPGTKVQITVNVGEELVEGKVPLTVSIESVTDQTVKQGSHFIEIPQPVLKPLRTPGGTASKLSPAFDSLRTRLKTYD